MSLIFIMIEWWTILKPVNNNTKSSKIEKFCKNFNNSGLSSAVIFNIQIKANRDKLSPVHLWDFSFLFKLLKSQKIVKDCG